MAQIIDALKPILLFVAIVWGISVLIGMLKPSKRMRPTKPNKTSIRQDREQFETSQYFQSTGHGYTEVVSDDGMLGEYLLSEQIIKAIPDGHLLLNLYVPISNTHTSEIDLVLIHETGVYVFESKNYAGWIFGSEGDKNWTQTFKTTRNQFPNPVRQNEGHIQALSTYLSLKRSVFLSVIVFGDNCELKKINADTTPILQTNQVPLFIRGLIESRQKHLSPQQCQEIFAKLEPLSHASDAIKEAHIQQLRNSFGPPNDSGES